MGRECDGGKDMGEEDEVGRGKRKGRRGKQNWEVVGYPAGFQTATRTQCKAQKCSKDLLLSAERDDVRMTLPFLY
jgi:hypothetical protein